MFLKGISHRFFLIGTALLITVLYIPVFLLNAAPNDQTGLNSKEVSILNISPNPAASGTYITVQGKNFTLKNTIHFADDDGDIIGDEVASTDGSTLLFQVPDTITSCEDPEDDSTCTDTKFQGTYSLSIENENGTSNSFDLVISDNSSVQATGINISSLSPTQGGLGTDVIITGNNFPLDSKSSVVFGSSVYNATVVSSNTITFKIQAQEEPLDDAQSYPVYVQFTDSAGTISTTNSLPFIFGSQVSNVSTSQTPLEQNLVITSGDRRGPAKPIITTNVKYTVNGDGTVTDTTNNLMWQQCVKGASGNDCSSGQPDRFLYSEATSTCKDNSFAGYSDWRPPFIEELQPLVLKMHSDTTFSTTNFPNDPQDFLWTKTSFLKKIPGVPVTSRYIVWNDGRTDIGFPYAQYKVRCVRNILAPGQTPPSLDNGPVNTNNTSIQNSIVPQISSINPSSVSVYTKVTINGSGFTPIGNFVYINGILASSNLASTNGSSIEFTIPGAVGSCATDPCTNIFSPLRSSYQIAIKNDNGVSKAFDLTLSPSENTDAGTGNDSGDQPDDSNDETAVQITSLSPNPVDVATRFTIFGSGFTKKNEVYVDGKQSHYSNPKPIASKDGTSINVDPAFCTFSVNPNDATVNCPSYLAPGIHSIYVKNENGQTSSFNLTVSDKNSSSGSVKSPQIISLNPNNYQFKEEGNKFSIIGTGFTQENNIYVDGEKVYYPHSIQYSYPSTNNGSQIDIQTRYCETRTVNNLPPSSGTHKETSCDTGLRIDVGQHTIQVVNQNGQTTKFTLTVTN